VVGFALLVVGDQARFLTLGVVGYLDRGLAFFVVGGLVGAFADRHRRLGASSSRSFDESPDLLWMADSSGLLTRVNPAWRRALGHPGEPMRLQPLTDLVHPSDRDAVDAEILALIDGSRGTVGSRARFESTDGSYRWFEWSAHASPSEGVIYGVAHDITAQRQAELRLANTADRLEVDVAEKTRDLIEARAETLQLLAAASEYGDDETSQHTERVGTLAAEIASGLGLSEESVALLREAAPLHDIGKLAIPDSVLLAPTRLTPAEQTLMESHAALGARLLFGSRSPVLQLAGVIAETHHERWDGTGYPNGLAGEAIPLVGRIVAVADVFDSVTHNGPSRSASSVAQALALVRRAAGTEFDPRIVMAFLAVQDGTTTPGRVPSVRVRGRKMDRSLAETPRPEPTR
jgi:PAS domain S-box-containing protein/putative nucleotidyltransferase with HDIG domain